MNRMLSEDYLVLASSPDPENVYAGSPSIARMRSGRLLASYEWFRPSPMKEAVPNQTEVLVSDDDGASWTKTASQDFIWATIWAHEDDAYLIGNRRRSRDIVIGRSRDGGITWEGRRLVPDVDESVEEVAGWITPRLGGVGPTTIAMLLKNTVDCCEGFKQHRQI